MESSTGTETIFNSEYGAAGNSAGNNVGGFEGVDNDFGEDDFAENDFGEDDFAEDDFGENDFGEDDFAEDDLRDDSTFKKISSVKISDIETQTNLSVEDLLDGVVAFNSDEIDEDMQDFNQMKEELLSKGYSNLDNANFEMLESLLNRSSIVDDPEKAIFEIGQIQGNMQMRLRAFHKNLLSSKGTLPSGDSPIQPEYLKDNLSDSGDSTMKTYVKAAIVRTVNSGYKINEEEILKAFSDFKPTVDFTKDDLIEYIHQVTAKVDKYNAKVRNVEKVYERAREYVSSSILQKDQILLKDFIQAPRSRIHFFKNLKTEGEFVVAECSECGKTIEMKNSPISFFTLAANKFQSGGEGSRICLMLPVQCGCGAYHLFTLDEYTRISREAEEFYKIRTTSRTRSSYLDSATDNISQICHGAVFTKIHPPVQCVVNSLPELIQEESDVTDIDSVEEKEETVVLRVDDIAFRTAVTEFYRKLHGFGRSSSVSPSVSSPVSQQANSQINYSVSFPISQQTGNETDVSVKGLTYREMAYCIVDVLSMDYLTVKTQALFSLIFYVMENPILSKSLDFLSICELESSINLLNQLTEKTIKHLDEMKISCLITLSLDAEPSFESLGNYKKSTDEKLHDLIKKTPVITEKLHNLLKEREEVLDFLDRYAMAFGYCKIINLSGVSRADLDKFICDEKSFAIFDKITDLMIINNYAAQYYQKWILFKCVNVSRLDTCLTVKTNRIQSTKTVTDILLNFVSKINENCVLDVSRIKDCLEPPTEAHELLREAYSYYQAGNFYRFCQKVCEANSTGFIDSYVSRELTEDLKKSLDRITKVLGNMPDSEAEYYLKDFSREEILENHEKIEFLTFGRYVLVANDDESIQEYLQRFEKLQAEDGLTCENSRDNFKLFEEYRHDVLVIATATIFSSMEWSSYSTAIFMVRSLMAINNCSMPFAIKKFMNLSDYYFQSMKNGIRLIRKEDLEVDIIKDFYRVVTAYYFTQAEDLVNKILSPVHKKIVTIGDDILISSEDKMDALTGLVDAIVNYQPKDANEIFDVDSTLQEVLDSIHSRELQRKLEGVK